MFACMVCVVVLCPRALQASRNVTTHKICSRIWRRSPDARRLRDVERQTFSFCLAAPRKISSSLGDPGQKAVQSTRTVQYKDWCREEFRGCTTPNNLCSPARWGGSARLPSLLLFSCRPAAVKRPPAVGVHSTVVDSLTVWQYLDESLSSATQEIGTTVQGSRSTSLFYNAGCMRVDTRWVTAGSKRRYADLVPSCYRLPSICHKSIQDRIQ